MLVLSRRPSNSALVNESHHRTCICEWAKLCDNKTLLEETNSGQIRLTSCGLPCPGLAEGEFESGGHVAGGILDKEWNTQRRWQEVTGGHDREQRAGMWGLVGPTGCSMVSCLRL